MNLKNSNEKHTLDSNVPKSNSHGEKEKQSCKSLINPKSFTQWLEPWSWHTFNGDGKNSGGYNSFSLKVKDNSLEKVMVTLRGVFIRFPLNLSDLSPLRA